MLDLLIDFRKELHTFPELSGKEIQTAQRISHFLLDYKPDQLIEKLGGHGIAAVYKFGQSGPSILIRCELDALPILEQNTFAYRSQVEGVSHKCGHDGHMAILAGLAPWLAQANFTKGKVILLFQPAEETGTGAAAVLKDSRFEAIQADYCFALHNMPGFPKHYIIAFPKRFCATVKSVAIRLRGKQAHSAQPENGINPALAMAEITQAMNKRVVNDQMREDFALITPIYTTMGAKEYGISAGYGEVHFTLRTWSLDQMDQLTDELETEVNNLAEFHSLQYEIEYFDFFPSVINDPECNQLISDAARHCGFNLIQKSSPFRFGEDFGWFTQDCPGAMFGLGAGEVCPVLHSNTYDFPDEIIPTGLEMFKEIIRQILR